MIPDNCETCGKPKKLTSGKMEDFLDICCCGQEELQARTVTICQNCGKRIENRRQGTITQYIFRYDNCSCDRPKPTIHSLDSERQERHSKGIKEEEFDEIELPEGSFPVERFKPIKELGRGGSGAVYLALDRFLKKTVSIKTLNRLDSDQLILFQNEARATSKLAHPNIVSILDFGCTEAEAPYMVLEYFDGSSLEHCLKAHGALSWSKLKPVLLKVCEALAYTHGQGVFHRDIKPSNVLISGLDSGSLSVRLIDFGVAKLVDIFKTTEFQGKTLAGTPEYMSPDVAKGLTYSGKSDIYSLGCLAYESLTGTPPFKAETALEVISQHANSTASRFSEVSDVEIEEEAESLVLRCLDKDPDSRPSIDELVEILRGESRIKSNQDETIIEFVRKKEISGTPIIVFATLLTILLVGVVIKQITSPHDEYSKLEPSINRVLDKAERIQEDPKKRKGYLADFTGFPWECGIVWYQKGFVTDQDLLAFDTKKGIKYLSLFGQQSFSDRALEHVLKQGLKGIGLGTTDTKLARIKLVVSVNPDLDAILLSSCELTNEDLTPLADFKKLRLLKLSNNNIGVRGLKHVAKIKTLEVLQVSNIANLAGKALVYIKQLPNLRCLCIDENKIENLDDWITISEMKNLTLLSAGATHLDDRALTLISQLNLKKLDVSENPISRNGLMILAQMKSLDTLILSGSQFHKFDIAQLRKSLPDCKLILENRLLHRDINQLMMEDKSLAGE